MVLHTHVDTSKSRNSGATEVTKFLSECCTENTHENDQYLQDQQCTHVELKSPSLSPLFQGKYHKNITLTLDVGAQLQSPLHLGAEVTTAARHVQLRHWCGL